MYLTVTGTYRVTYPTLSILQRNGGIIVINYLDDDEAHITVGSDGHGSNIAGEWQEACLPGTEKLKAYLTLPM